MERICQQKWRHGEQASPLRDDMCRSCFSNTKYTCLKFRSVISAQHSNLSKTQRLAAGRCVGYCEPCFREKISGDGGKKAQPDQGKVKYALL